MSRMRLPGRSVAALTALSLSLTPAAPLLAEQSGPPKPATPAAAPVTTVTAPVADRGWPRAYSTPSGGQIVVYQPQIASWPEQRHLVAYSAVSYQAKGAAQPALGQEGEALLRPPARAGATRRLNIGAVRE